MGTIITRIFCHKCDHEFRKGSVEFQGNTIIVKIPPCPECIEHEISYATKLIKLGAEMLMREGKKKNQEKVEDYGPLGDFL